MNLKKIAAFILIITFAAVNMVAVHAADTAVTNVDALKMAMDASGIAPKKVANAKDWKEGYIQAAHEQKIIDQTAFRKKLTAKATKEDAAELFAKSLKITTDKQVYFADTKSVYANSLYALKIVDGTKDKNGKLYFKPNAQITTAELKAMADKTVAYVKTKQKTAPATVTAPTLPTFNTYPEPVAQPAEESCH